MLIDEIKKAKIEALPVQRRAFFMWLSPRNGTPGGAPLQALFENMRGFFE